ncbi:MAG: pyridoxamine 5'-phosphate oxidase [bacterium]
MLWEEFTETCPELAEMAKKRFARDQLVLVGTLRTDGWPRISPCEVDIAAGHLFLGMMWRSTKALDLLRDSRVIVHSVQCDREAGEADIKLYGRAIEIGDPTLRKAFRDAIKARIDWAPDEPSFHLFSVDVERAACVAFSGGQRIMTWDSERGLRRWSKTH